MALTQAHGLGRRILIAGCRGHCGSTWGHEHLRARRTIDRNEVNKLLNRQQQVVYS